MNVLKSAVITKGSEGALDLPAWQWLLKVVDTLGVDGASSEESDCEESIRTIYRTKKMPWRRRDLSDVLSIVDDERLIDKTIYHSQGSKPVPRQRERNRGPESRRPPPSNLPLAFYDDAWFNSLDEASKREVDPNEEEFEWVHLTVDT